VGDERPSDGNVKHAFWLLVIAFALSALSGGYLSGRAAVPRFPSVSPHASSPPPMQEFTSGVPQTDELAKDQFVNDAVAPSDATSGEVTDDARLAIAVVDAGHSVALESPFLSLGVPVTLVIDPQASAARDIFALALQSGAQTYLQVNAPLTAAKIQSLHPAFPRAAGIAARFTAAPSIDSEVAAALRRVNWGVLDEYGGESAVARAFSAAGVRYAARTITVDDHVQRTYVTFMLQQAVHLARGRTAIVMARPFPGTLQAFEDLLTRASRDGVRFVGL
jgi:polysaccharide deacetylase 2 family uncharacterized protein YibQ